MFGSLRYILMTILVAVGLPLFFWVCGFMVFCIVIQSVSEPPSLEKMDAAIVLTGGTNRVERGLDLIADKTVDHLLVSGVHKDVKMSDLINLWGEEKYLPQEKITLGREAGNTIGNALEARKWVEDRNIHSVYVITSNYHIPRAMLEFRHGLPNIKLIPYPVRPTDFLPLNRIYWKISLLEYHKLLMSLYRVIVYPKETNPIPSSLISTPLTKK